MNKEKVHKGQEICLSSTPILMQSSSRKQKLIFPIAGADTHACFQVTLKSVCIDRTVPIGSAAIHLLISPLYQLFHWENVMEHCDTVSTDDSVFI